MKGGGIGCTKLGARNRDKPGADELLAKYIIYDILIVEWNEKVH